MGVHGLRRKPQSGAARDVAPARRIGVAGRRGLRTVGQKTMAGDLNSERVFIFRDAK